MNNLYNGRTIAEIEKNLPFAMIQTHKDFYIANCKQVINNQITGYNLNEIECIKNTNFELIKFYY